MLLIVLAALGVVLDVVAAPEVLVVTRLEVLVITDPAELVVVRTTILLVEVVVPLSRPVPC